MSALEDQLLDTLAKTYISKGKSLAKLLDNPIFIKVPLEKKIAILTKYSKSAPQPSLDVKALAGHAGMGALAGLGAMMAMAPGASPLKMALGVGTGTLFGSLLPTISTMKIHKRDMASDTDLRSNRFLEAIAERSMGSSMPPPKVDLQKLISLAENTSYSTIASHPDL